MSVERFVDEIAKGVRREVDCRTALNEILDYAERAIEGDRNPNKGDLMKVSRIAAEALEKTEVGNYACPTCGENVTRYGQRCDRCTASLEEDRLERESGR